ncbi:unnamed protein product [Strongylus vulgaris]|uniref:Vacuolar protein sorting-associated protein 54 C-terminal domain-containing protein n=1 Tax=Strongylus vulgaris TaxID=40348 RepID=A0A3P7KLV4_STRVU|nr:unnamed protein product [Strongylus vulgaris]
MLDAEIWKASEVAAEFQCLVDESVRTGQLRNVHTSGGSAGGEALMVEGVPYVVVRSALVFLKILADYCECFVALPTFAVDILSRVVELLKGFNSRSCQLILGAGALQLVGLKTISVRNLGKWLYLLFITSPEVEMFHFFALEFSRSHGVWNMSQI